MLLPLFQPKSKNDTWSEKELAAVLKPADGHTGKSSGGGREHGSRDKRSSSSVKGQTTKEGGSEKRDAAVVLAKGEGGREQKHTAPAGSSKEKVRSHVLFVWKNTVSRAVQCMYARCLVF